MLCKIIEIVIALSFLLAILLEVAIGMVLIRSDLMYKSVEKADKKTPRLRKVHRKVLKKRKNKEEIKFETLLNNIDIYDGTDYGQKDIE